jgi:hypothetical protein
MAEDEDLETAVDSDILEDASLIIFTMRLHGPGSGLTRAVRVIIELDRRGAAIWWVKDTYGG